MRMLQAKTALQAALAADLPMFLWGAPGIGKSELVAQIASAMSLPLIDMRAALLDPLDLRGLPTVENRKAVWVPMGELPDAERDGAEGILFLDELNAAPSMVQAACFGLVLNRRLGEYHLPPGWRVIAAGNRQTDRASAQRMPSALANRFMHAEIEPDNDSWSRWALGAGIPAELVAFLRFRPSLLHDFEADRTINATPRTWVMASRVIKAGLDPETELDLLSGTVGPGPAAELVAFLRVWRTLPSPEGVLMNPDSASVPDDPATLYALMGALARKVSDNSMANFVRYLGRVPAEYGVAAMRDAIARDETLQSTSGFVSWAAANSDVVL